MKYKTNIYRPFDKELYQLEWRESKIIGVAKQFVRDVKRCWQRAFRGYCDHDPFSIFDWFLGIMPAMLQNFKDTMHGYPEVNEFESHRLLQEGEESENKKAWDEILDRMIFLMREAGEETCTRKNPYEEEYGRARDEFEAKYGSWGEKLKTAEDIQEEKKTNTIRMFFPHDVPEYKPISDKYYEEEKNLREYRFACKDEALALFSKWFFHLWD